MMVTRFVSMYWSLAALDSQDAKLKASDEEKMKLEKTVEAAKKEVSEADKKVKAAEEEKKIMMEKD